MKQVLPLFRLYRLRRLDMRHRFILAYPNLAKGLEPGAQRLPDAFFLGEERGDRYLADTPGPDGLKRNRGRNVGTPRRRRHK
jgi:hypothetical protein